jgi:LCP family protein required for cell wall assembly
VPTGYFAVPSNPTPIPTPALAPAAPFPSACDGPGRINILLIGLDGRSGNYQRAARADAIAVLGVNFADRTARLLSIPRDLWVPLPGLPENRTPEGKINTAYVWGEADKLPGGGPGYLATVLTSTFNLRIDRFAVINFTAFEDAVDAIGGIDIDVPTEIHDARYPVGNGSTMVVDIPAGWVHFDGEAALIYARTRHQDGDFARMRRQQSVLMAVRDKVLSAEALPYLPALVQALHGTVYTNVSFDDIALLGCVAPQISRESIQAMAIDQTMVYSWRSPKNESALQPKMELIEPVLQAWSAGQ